MNEYYIKFGSLKIGIGIILVLSLFTINPLATFLAILYLPVSAKLLWKKNEPPVLFFALLMQWAQVCVKVLYADYIFQDFGNLFLYFTDIHKAYYYSLSSLYAINIGIFLVLRNKEPITFEVIKKKFEDYNLKKVTITYIIATATLPFIILVSYLIPGTQQFFVKLLDLKWALFFMLFCRYFLFDVNKKIIYIILVLEILMSFTGYFSSFKDFFFIGGIAYIFVKRSFSLVNYMFSSVIVVLLFNLLVVWQYVKPEYRKYLSGGENAQSVTVSKSDALLKLYDLTSESENIRYEDAVVTLLDRMAYIDIFSAAITYVPHAKPHEEGRLWFDAISRIFMPRILFPNKSIIDDTGKTITYTGLPFAGSESGTSISLGYVAETYIDFGYPLMLIPLLLWGVLIGLIFNYIIKNSYNELWGYALIMPFTFQINLFETALDKAFGSMIFFVLICWFLNKYVIKKIDQYITN
ncbi:hypothetical protein [Pedobacter insulae]|uniref:O-antigen polysaccharide polymerase Wzy n=1 Tax=Pedobacter insulae TaxID=414048 RepID=A0A1I2VVZ2_9SPHI|nr:hypothetical protein [Pedobacter insulae]SFG93243.1 hypothetical protein SAMN04489864_103299 [Pedobacter insulae]